jgi:GTP-binding protein Era
MGRHGAAIAHPPATRSGFVALAGRPNVGKSTLANAIVGAKVAIVSDKPQTTRRAIRGVATGPDWQLVLVDLPGVQRPRDALTERMQHRVEHELSDADACLLVLNADGPRQPIGPGDRFIAELLRPSAQSGALSVVIAVNKIDRVDKARTAEVLQGADRLGIASEIFPVSARTGAGVQRLTDHLVGLLTPTSAPISRAPCISPSSSASRCSPGPARRFRTRSRWRSPRSATHVPTSSASRRWCCRRPSPRRGS